MEVKFTPQAVDDLGAIRHLRRQVQKRARELAAPGAAAQLGKPLGAPLTGYRRLQVHGDHRLVYAVRDTEVVIIAIAHRKKIYGIVSTRVP